MQITEQWPYSGIIIIVEEHGPIDFSSIISPLFLIYLGNWVSGDCFHLVQTIDTFQDSVMSVNLTNTEIIAGSVDGTIRTFDIRMGR